MFILSLITISLFIIHGSTQEQQTIQWADQTQQSNLTQETPSVCRSLHVGTELRQGGADTNDVIQNGVPTSVWNPTIDGAPIVSASKNLDFFYLSKIDIELEQANVMLSYNNSEHVKSQALVKKEERGYTIEVSYDCDSYGGNLIPFNLTIDIPNCGNATIAWKKLCGNPFQPRDGLAIDMKYDDKSEPLVKNGKILDPKKWDRDINNYAFFIPRSTNKISLEMYMNGNDIVNETSNTAHAFNTIQQNADKRYNLNTYVATVRADSDKNVVNVEVMGGVPHQGAMVNETKQSVDILFHCTGRGPSSTIEIDVVLPVFKDITMFFVKNCDWAGPPESNNALSVLFFWFTVLVLAAFCYMTHKNVTEKGKKGLSAIPFYDEINGLCASIRSKLSSKNKFEKLQDKEDHELSTMQNMAMNYAEEEEDVKPKTFEPKQPVSKGLKGQANHYGTIKE